MRMLFVGAGAVGGYFGARLLQAGRDVTFLVRPARRQHLLDGGLVVESPHGGLTLHPPLVLESEVEHPYDVVVLSCKAYDLDGAMDSAAVAMGPDSMLLPLLNGMRHLDALDARFGAARVLGGSCSLASTLTAEGHVHHMSRLHTILFGARQPSQDAMAGRLAEQFDGTLTEWHQSPCIVQEMWEKWVFLSVLAGATCLMRASIGTIMAAGGESLLRGMLAETQGAAIAHGFGPRPGPLAAYEGLLTDPRSPLTASMMRDLEAGGRTEGEHIIADLIARGTAKGVAMPLMTTALIHVRAYEARSTAPASAN